MATPDNQIKTVLTADVSGYKQGMNDAAGSTGDFKRKAEEGAKSADGLGRGLDGAAGAARNAGDVLGGLGQVIGGNLVGGVQTLVGALPIASAALVAAGAAAFGLARHAAVVADETGRMAERLGLSTEAMSEYQYAARIAGVSTSALEGGLGSLQEAIRGQSPALAAMGIATRDAAGNARDLKEVLPEVAQAFAGYGQGADKATLANEVFGSQYDALLPLLDRGAEGLRELTGEASTYGAVISGELATASRDFNEDMARLEGMLPALIVEIGGPLVASVRSVAQEFLSAKAAGLGFIEAVRSLGSASPLRSYGEQIKLLSGDLERLRGGERNKLISFTVDDEVIRHKERLLDYYKRVQKAEADASISAADMDANDRRAAAGAQALGQASAEKAANLLRAGQVLQKLSGTTATYQQDLKALMAARDAGDLSEQKYVAAVQKLIAIQPAAREMTRSHGAAARKAAQDFDFMAYAMRGLEEEIRRVEALEQARRDSVAAGERAALGELEQLEESARKRREETAEIGLSAQALVDLRAERLEHQASLKDEAAATLEALEPGSRLAEIYRQQAEALRDLAAANREGGVSQAAEAAKQMDEFSKNFARDMQSGISDFLVSPFEDGLEGMGESFGRFLQKLIADAIAADVTRYLLGDEAGVKGGTAALAKGVERIFGGAAAGAGGAGPAAANEDLFGKAAAGVKSFWDSIVGADGAARSLAEEGLAKTTAAAVKGAAQSAVETGVEQQATTAMVSLAGAANSAAASMAAMGAGGGGGGGGLGGLLGAAGGFLGAGGGAETIANALPGDALDNWFQIAAMASAQGNAFTSLGPVRAFAMGGAFGNGEILTKPTFFPFKDGGAFRMGVAGEAGDEGALPLKRMSNGKLGVYADGAGRGGDVHIHQSFPAGTPAQTRASAAQGAREGLGMVKRMERYG